MHLASSSSSSSSIGGGYGHLHHSNADWSGWLFLFVVLGAFLLFVCFYGGYAYGYSRRTHRHGSYEVRDADNKVERRVIYDEDSRSITGDAFGGGDGYAPGYYHHHHHAHPSTTVIDQVQLRY